jgi:hypothetical protein
MGCIHSSRCNSKQLATRQQGIITLQSNHPSGCIGTAQPDHLQPSVFPSPNDSPLLGFGEVEWWVGPSPLWPVFEVRLSADLPRRLSAETCDQVTHFEKCEVSHTCFGVCKTAGMAMTV